MKTSPHILVSENPLTEGRNHKALCGKEVVKAHWVRTDGDLRNIIEWVNCLNSACNKCRAKYMKTDDEETARMKVYFAVDGQLARRYQKSEVPEIQRSERFKK